MDEPPPESYLSVTRCSGEIYSARALQPGTCLAVWSENSTHNYDIRMMARNYWIMNENCFIKCASIKLGLDLGLVLVWTGPKLVLVHVLGLVLDLDLDLDLVLSFGLSCDGFSLCMCLRLSLDRVVTQHSYPFYNSSSSILKIYALYTHYGLYNGLEFWTFITLILMARVDDIWWLLLMAIDAIAFMARDSPTCINRGLSPST